MVSFVNRSRSANQTWSDKPSRVRNGSRESQVTQTLRWADAVATYYSRSFAR